MPELRKLIIAAAVVALFAGLAGAQVGTPGPGGGGVIGGPFVCSVTNGAVPPILRAESYADLAGDIVLVCSGGAPLQIGSTVPTANITVFINTAVTSRLLSNTTTASEALLLVNEPGSTLQGYGPILPQIPCTVGGIPAPAVGAGPGGCSQSVGSATVGGTAYTGVPVDSSGPVNYLGTGTPGANVFQGITSNNTIAFNGIPVLPPATSGDTLVLRITNIRVNANGIAAGGSTPGMVSASISIDTSVSLAIGGSNLTIGFVQPGLSTTSSARNAGNTGRAAVTLNQGASQSIAGTSGTSGALGVLQFIENFVTAFKVQGTNTQNIPGNIYNSENGFTQTLITNGVSGAGAETAGIADYGTRLKATFSNVPSGVSLYVTARDVTNDFSVANATGYSGAQAQLVSSETAIDTGNVLPVVSQTTVYGPVTSIPLAAVAIDPTTRVGLAVWEITATNPNQIDTVNFGMYISYTANVAGNSPAPGYISVTLSYAPTPNGGAFNSSVGSRPSSSLTLPRFSDSLDIIQTAAGIASATNQPLSITGPSSLPAATADAEYTGPIITATGGTGLYAWSATGLPAGMVMNPGSGVIAGTPSTNTGSPFALTVTVTDTNSATANKSYSLTINPVLSITGSSTLPAGVANAAYTPTAITAVGGSGSYTWSAINLPAGLSIAQGTGVISGTPTANTTNSSIFNFEVVVTDSNSVTAFQTYTLTIYPAGSRPQSPVVTQQAEVLTAPRSSTDQALLFSYVTSLAGFDTEITISNTSHDTLGSTAQSGSCNLYYYGINTPATNPQITPQIAAGAQFTFRLSQGGSGLPAIPNFSGYVIANCGFPLARGFANSFGGTIGFAQSAQLITRPRGSVMPVALLFPFVTNQSGYDTGITIANTSLDPFGTSVTSGACSLYFYGTGAPAAQPFITRSIGAGSVYANLASAIAPGFQGYAIADCNFSNAASFAFVSDAGARQIALSEVPQLLTLPRSTANQPLLFSNVTSQNGYDTEIAIANTSADPFGTANAYGSCTLNFFGSNAPAFATTWFITPGSVSTGLVSQMAPGFAGYIAAACVPPAQGWAYTGLSANGAFLVDGDSNPAELVTLPRSTSASSLLFSAASNWNGADTNITISNTSQDPFGSTAGSGACTISYFGNMLNGGATPTPQVSDVVAAGGQLSFTLSQGNSAQGIAGAPGFRGYVIADCGFPLARGLATITGAPPGDTVDVTIGASPAVPAITISVDGTSYAAPQTFSWVAGSAHTIGATVATSGPTQYVFSNWSNGGLLRQSITAPSSYATYTVNFQASQYNSCDLTQTGSTTVADVQLMINQALGVAATVYDLSGNGVSSVVDVQLEINAALGLGCAGQ